MDWDLGMVGQSSKLNHFSAELGSQGLIQDLETGCPKLASVKLLGILYFKGDLNIFKFQP